MEQSSLPSLMSTTLPFNRIGRFYITHELGYGSTGCVYLGHDPVIDRHVAIKTFIVGVKKQHEQQLINEARAAGRLSHPNIVTIFDASSEGETAYIAMEYLQGDALSKLLDSGRCFTADETASISYKIADALAHAHKNGVTHRDIKPANIFIVAENQPKLVDFGIARAPNRVPIQTTKSDQPFTIFHNNVLGTPHYMSPEQAQGKAADTRSDIYSLGAVMYEMLVGRPPFQASDIDKLLQQIQGKTPPAPHEVNATIPVKLSQIVMKAIRKYPEKRYQDANQIALDLKRYLTQQRRQRRHVRKAVDLAKPDSTKKNISVQRHLFWIGYPALIAAGALFFYMWLR